MNKTFDLNQVLVPDQLGSAIANKFISWDNARQGAKSMWKEIRDYVYATDTSQTSNSLTPWSNTTTIPKMCQIRDNLLANYEQSLFPKRRWLEWLGSSEENEEKKKKDAVEAYMTWVTNRNEFRNTMLELLQDYVENGNAIATAVWSDGRIEHADGQVDTGYVGPLAVRISPYDIVFNPLATDIRRTPKILRSLYSIGEVAKMVEHEQNPETQEAMKGIFDYMLEYRAKVGAHQGGTHEKEDWMQIDGFGTFTEYLTSDYCEILKFYGDIYDQENNELYENHEIWILDRCKVFLKRPVRGDFGYGEVYHSPWRRRPDNLWGMGPLENLIGMQYRIDHVENAKADLLDLLVVPPLKVKGYVQDFEWGPMEKINVGDDGDVELLQSNFDSAKLNLEVNLYQEQMELMAGAPKEAMGFRTPGEKTMFEVQRLENAASRIFQTKIQQFERDIVEPLLNSMLSLAKRNVDEVTVRVLDDEKFADFLQLTKEDITGSGTLRPFAAQHFAEKAERVQNLTNFWASGIAQDQAVSVHWSGLQLSRLFEELFDLEDFKIVSPYVRVAEMADQQRQMNALQEQVMTEAGTPAGLAEDDTDEEFAAAGAI